MVRTRITSIRDYRLPFSILGSIQHVKGIPEDIKEIFLTAWELNPRTVIDLAADRGPFIDQTQSMSLNIAHPNPDLLVRSKHLYVSAI